jgi:hypothetical protein
MFPSDNPLPFACVLLVALLPAVLAAGAELAARASDDVRTRRVIAPGAALAAWLVAVCAIARIAGAFVPGLVAGTGLVAALGARRLLSWARARPRFSAREALPTALFVAFAVATIAPGALRYYFHDETLSAGHLATVSQMENGYFPPRSAFFPSFEFKYHYGFDLLAAMLSGLFRLDAAAAIDLTTLALWGYTAALAAHLGVRLTGARRGFVTAFFALFGAGSNWGCPPAGPLGYQLTGHCVVGGFKVNPPVASYFFQHPFGLGIPLALAVLCLLADRDTAPVTMGPQAAPNPAPAEPAPRRGRYVLYGVLLLAVFLGQIVLFFTVSASLAVCEGLVDGRFEKRRALAMLATLAAVYLGARLLGAFFAPAPYALANMLVPHAGVTGDLGGPIGSLNWTLRSYGFLLPLGVAGLFLLRRERPMLALLAAGSFVVPNVVHYKLTADIVKFATVAQLVLSIAASAVVVRLLQLSPARPRAWRAASAALAAALLALGTAFGFGFHAALWLNLKPIKPNLEMRPEKLAPPDLAVLRYLRRHVGAEEIVYRRQNASLAYNQWGGLAMPWLGEEMFGFGEEPRAARKKLLASLPAEIGAYTGQNIRWFVLDASDTKLRDLAAAWVRAGQAEVVMEEGGLRVVRAR